LLHYTFTRLQKLANRCQKGLNNKEDRKTFIKMLDSLDAQESELFDLKEYIEEKKTKAKEDEAKNKGKTGEGNGLRRGSEDVGTSDVEESSSN
jgi:hypothetical protein